MNLSESYGHDLEYPGEIGTRHVGYLARPAAATGAAVLIAHAAPGVGEHEREVARRLARLGYVALVADYHGDGVLLDREAMMTRLGPVAADPSLLRLPMRAALAALRAQPGVEVHRIAVIGYCLGGAAAVELARDGAEVQAAVGFHASLPVNRPEDARNIRGEVLILNGAADPMVPPDVRTQFEAQMNAAGADWRMVLFGGVQHGFTFADADSFGVPGVAYDRKADERSYKAMLELLAERIGPATG